MATWSDGALRRLALIAFAAGTALTVVAIVLSVGLHGRAGLRTPGAGDLDVGGAINFAALLLSGLLLTWFRPHNPIGWLLTLSGLLGVLCSAGQIYGTRAVVVPQEHLPLGLLALAVSAPLWVPCLLIPPTMLLLRYPAGLITGRWDWRFDRAAVVGLALVWAGYATSSNSVTDQVTGHVSPVQLPSAVSGAIMLTGVGLLLVDLVAIAGSTARRMMRSGYPERQQIAWLLTATFSAFFLVFLPVKLPGTLGFALIPLAIAVGLLRYRLLGIEVVVRRALLYGTLTALVVLVFVAVTAGLANVMPHGPAPVVLAASLIAIGLTPARERVQRLVDRVVYGQRNDPWGALQRLSTPLEGQVETDVLPAIVGAVAEAVRAPGAALLAADGTPVAVSGDTVTTAVSIPVRYGGEELGTLAVSPRRGEPQLAAADRRLLDAVAPLVAAVWHAARLAAELDDAQSRLVGATESERERLRRELHDGLGPSLTGIGLGLEALERAGGARRTELVARLRTETARSLDEVRRIIDGLRPGALTERDLLFALSERVAQVNANSAVHVDLRAPSVVDLPPDIEAAAYRIADEALVNVLKHANAHHCAITISVDDCLHLSVADDGVGLNGHGRGVGMGSMRWRAQRLGGTFRTVDRAPGLEVQVDLPVSAR